MAEADISGILIDYDSPVGVANKNAVSVISEGMESLKKIGVEVDKHKKDAVRGWRIYNVRFGSESIDGIVYYAGKLKVRMGVNGTDYAYDIVDIIKKDVPTVSLLLITALTVTGHPLRRIIYHLLQKMQAKPRIML